MKQAQIFVFGDSITYGAWDKESGWAARLRRFLDEKNMSEKCDFEVYNLGIPGNTTTDVLERFEFELKQRLDEDMDIIVIFAIGENDAQFIHSQESLRTASDIFKKNIQKLAQLAQKYTSKIIFVGLLPVVESKTTPFPWNRDKSYKNQNIALHNAALKSFCKEKKLDFVDLFDTWYAKKIEGFLDADGLHPNDEGHKRIFEKVKECLKKYL